MGGRDKVGIRVCLEFSLKIQKPLPFLVQFHGRPRVAQAIQRDFSEFAGSEQIIHVAPGHTLRLRAFDAEATGNTSSEWW